MEGNAMKQKGIAIILSVAILILVASTLIACNNNTPTISTSQGLNYKLTNDEQGYICIGIGSFEGDILNIPDTYQDLPVVEISDYAFQSSNIKQAIVPDSVVRIGKGAFQSCEKLESITIPFVGESTTTTTSEYQLFGYIFGVSNSNYQSYDLPDSLQTVIITGGEKIAEGAFSYRDCNITRVVIADSITKIENDAFEACSSLQTVELSDKSKLQSIGTSAFSGCINLNSITIPSSVTEIKSSCFAGCKKLIEIYNLSELNLQVGSAEHGSIAKYAKYIYTSVPSVSNFIDKGDFTFYNDKGTYYLVNYKGKQRQLILPSDIDGKPYSVYQYAFYGNRSATSVYIPQKVKDIGDFAFSGCVYVTDIKLECDNQLQSIGVSAFAECTALQTVDLANNNKIVSIGDSAFTRCINLSQITIPDSVVSIGRSAFLDCEKLAVVAIGPSSQLQSIEASAFENCKLITQINIPDTVTKLSSQVFYNCIKLTDIKMPSNLEYLGRDAFFSTGYYGNKANWTNGVLLYIDKYLVSVDVDNLKGVCQVRPDTKVIATGAFYHCRGLTEIEIPEGVAEISDNMFGGCTSLVKVVVADSVQSIGEKAFYECANLKDIAFGADSKLNNIGYRAFWECTGLTNITIPQNVKSIADSAFYGCSNLNAVNTNDVASWCAIEFASRDANPLYYAHNLYVDGVLISKLEVPDGTTSIGANNFYGCNNITELVVPDSVTFIGFGAFEGCNNIQKVTLPFVGESRDKIAWKYHFGYIFGATQNKHNNEKVPSVLTTVIVTDTKLVASYSFLYCSNITNITIKEGTEVIEQYAFKDCTKLSSITLPSSLVSLYASTFENTAYYNNQSNWSDGWLYLNNILLQASATSSFVIKDGTTFIADYAFSDIHTLSALTIPDSVTTIGEYAFQNCTALTTVTIPRNVKYLTGTAFSGCTALQSLSVDSDNQVYHSKDNCLISTATKTLVVGCKNSTIPTDGSVTSIGRYAFSNCKQLTDIIIPDTILKIGDWAFNGCVGLTSITLPKNLLEIGEYAFINCENLQTVKFEANTKLTVIGKGAFYQCNSLDKFYVPSTVTSLGAYAFYGCKSLTNVQFANNSQLSIIGESAFRECPALTSIIIPDKVTKLDSTMFFKCTSLTYVVLPSGITDIGPEVFHTCSNLDTVYFKGTAEEWNNISVGYSNESLLSAEICFYSQSRPTSSGNFWHYVNGIATKW